MQKVILFKKEVTYGTDSVPTPAANAVLTRNFQAPKPVEVDQLDRKLDLPAKGRRKSAPTNRRSPYAFEVELAGSGAAGTAAAWMELLECCGMAAPTITAATKAEQKFAAEGVALSSGSCYHWMSEQRVRPLGSRGTWGCDFTANQYPFLKLNMIGLLSAGVGVDATVPGGAPDFTRWKDPLEVNTANTDFLLDGHALILQSLTIDANKDVKPRNLVGANYVNLGDHALTGRIRGEAPSIAAKNHFTLLDSGAEMVMQLIHGTVAGNIVQLDAAHVQVLDIDRSEEDDKLMLDISIGLNIVAGQDDLLFTAK
ncbi:MAG: hypothetical protein QOI38_3125 [Sphingomonadales bacterium]|jgi:hypothetical protein|nr:hypothetical protein [Sphingomonadales bacterium]